jgi:hypothetical protein
MADCGRDRLFGHADGPARHRWDHEIDRLAHDSEKWEPFFGQDHAPIKRIAIAPL